MNFYRLVLMAFFLLLSSFALADEAVAQKLNKLLSNSQSFSANFEQVIVDGGGNNMQKTSGELTVKRPGLFYWRTHKPYQQLLISDGKQTWFYDIDLDQVTVRKTDQRLTNTPALLLSGDVGELTSSFKIIENKLGDIDTIFELTPLGKDKVFEMMLLAFHEGQLAEMRLQDGLGQITRLEFSDVKQNPKIDEKIFHFTPPKGVDVMTE
jgi:outer membrane lipoprotein carrier protein